MKREETLAKQAEVLLGVRPIKSFPSPKLRATLKCPWCREVIVLPMKPADIKMGVSVCPHADFLMEDPKDRPLSNKWISGKDGKDHEGAVCKCGRTRLSFEECL